MYHACVRAGRAIAERIYTTLAAAVERNSTFPRNYSLSTPGQLATIATLLV